MIDRDERNRLTDLIRRYLDEQVTAFDFDEALDVFRDSEDSAVQFVSDAVWYHYDDFADHLVVLSKPQWDYFQRLLLLLESSSTVVADRSRHWTIAQPAAAALLIACGLMIVQTGFGSHLFMLFIPFGIASILLSMLRRPIVEPGLYDAIVTPFRSIGDLRTAYNSASFAKRRYPSRLNSRRIRSPFMDWFWTLYCYVLWAILAPIPLLIQCFPATTTSTVVDAV